MDALLQDLRYAVRSLRKSPGFTTVAVLTLALGIGATTAVYTVVDATLLRPVPYAYAERLVDVFDRVSTTSTAGGNSLTPAKIAGWQKQPAIFPRFEAYMPRQYDLTGGAEPERIDGLVVSTGLFDMLGVRPRVGRTFAAGEGRPGDERVAIISEALWQRRFAAAADALGRQILLNDDPYTIIGVMPRRFRLLRESETVWMPIDVGAASGDADLSGFYGLARLPRHMTVADAQQQVDSVAAKLQKSAPLRRSWNLRLAGC